VDKKDMEQVTAILKDLRLDMNTVIFIKQIIKCNGLPFKTNNLNQMKN